MALQLILGEEVQPLRPGGNKDTCLDAGSPVLFAQDATDDWSDSGSDLRGQDGDGLINSATQRNADGCVEVANTPYSIFAEPVQKTSTGSTFFQAAMNDIHSMAVFNTLSTDIPFHSYEEFSSNKNLVADKYFASEPKGIGERDLDLDFSVASPHACGSRKRFKLVMVANIVSDSLGHLVVLVL